MDRDGIIWRPRAADTELVIAAHGLGGWDEERLPDRDRRVLAVCHAGEGAGAGTGVPGTCEPRGSEPATGGLSNGLGVRLVGR